jgi:hypothetical protein
MMMIGKIFTDAGLAVPESLRQAMAEALQAAPLQAAPLDAQLCWKWPIRPDTIRLTSMNI